MRRFLLPLLAALALPTSVNAETIWFVYGWASTGRAVMDKIEVESMEDCEEKKKSFSKNGWFSRCLIGK